MVEKENRRLSKEDWLMAALKICEEGIDKVKVAPLAAQMGVTTGSFYWHFKNRVLLAQTTVGFMHNRLTLPRISSVFLVDEGS